MSIIEVSREELLEWAAMPHPPVLVERVPFVGDKTPSPFLQWLENKRRAELQEPLDPSTT